MKTWNQKLADYLSRPQVDGPPDPRAVTVMKPRACVSETQIMVPLTQFLATVSQRP